MYVQVHVHVIIEYVVCTCTCTCYQFYITSMLSVNALYAHLHVVSMYTLYIHVFAISIIVYNVQVLCYYTSMCMFTHELSGVCMLV